MSYKPADVKLYFDGVEIGPIDDINISDGRAHTIVVPRSARSYSWEGSVKAEPGAVEALLEIQKRLEESYFRRLALKWFRKARAR